jgi:alpha-D-ribose 1-methylphosphonate 5-triphosphate diphosphatase PhnM
VFVALNGVAKFSHEETNSMFIYINDLKLIVQMDFDPAISRYINLNKYSKLQSREKQCAHFAAYKTSVDRIINTK